MLNILIGLLFLICANLTLQHEISNFLTNVIDFSFNVTNCLHVIIVNDTELSVHLNKLELNVPVLLTVITGNSSAKQTNKEEKICDGYVILANNFNATHQLFANDILTLRVHKRILIVAFDYANDKTPYASSVNLEGMDIVLVEGLNYQQQQPGEYLKNKNEIANNKFAKDKIVNKVAKIDEINKNNVKNDNFRDDLRSELILTSVRDNVVLNRWKTLDDVQLLTGKLALIRWQPKFGKNQYFRAITFNLPPFVYYTKERGVYDGLEQRILADITKDWPVRYSVETDQSYYGLKEKVARGKQEVAFVSLWTVPIMTNTEITFPYSETCITFLVPKPELFQENLMVYQPLKYNFWLLMLTLTLTVGVILTKKNDKTLGILHAIRLLTVTGLPPHFFNQKTHFNIVLLLWCILSLLITTVYISGLSSVLAYPRYTKNINTLEDMVRYGTQWTAPDNDTLTTFSRSPNFYTREIAERFVYEDVMKEREKYIVKGNMAIKVQDSNTFLDVDLTHEESKSLKALPGCVVTSFLIYVLKQNSAYKEIFDGRIKRIVEHGLMKSYVIEVKKLRNDAETFMRLTTKPGKQPEPITLLQLQGAFYLLYVGYILTGAVFLSEFLYAKKIKKRNC